MLIVMTWKRNSYKYINIYVRNCDWSVYGRCLRKKMYEESS